MRDGDNDCKVTKYDNGLIALITDFGNKDYFVGIMKGVIKKINPTAEIIDISNDVPSYNLLAASFIVEQSYRFFPPGAIFLVVVDPGVGTERKILLVEYDGYFFIAPDNSVLTPILNKEDKKVYILDNEKYFLIHGHSTFEGRDKMAPAAAYLSRGIAPGEMTSHLSGQEFTGHEFILNPGYFPSLSKNGIEGQIIYIDKFGNVITNVKADFLANILESRNDSKFKLTLNGKEIKRFYDTYGHAGSFRGTFMLTGSHQNIEIAANQQSAASLLNAGIGQKIFIEFY